MPNIFISGFSPHTRATGTTANNEQIDQKHVGGCDAVVGLDSQGKLAALVKDITPNEPPTEWDVDEPESVSALREVRPLLDAQCSFPHTHIYALSPLIYYREHETPRPPSQP